MKMTKQEYDRYIKERAPKSPIAANLIKAFIGGGLICVVGQFLLNTYGAAGLDETSAAAATSITLVFVGALLTGLGIYDNLGKMFGAGTLVPITGFANSIVSPAMEFKSEGFITGMAAKMFVIAGPVLVYGTASSVLYGVILLLFSR